MEDEKNLAENIRKEYMYVLKKQRELHAFEECDNIEEVLFARVRRALDLSDLMKETRLNFKRTRKILNKYAKDYKKEIDVKKLLKKQEEELIMIERRYVESMVELMLVVIRAFTSEIFRNKLTSFEDWYEFDYEDMILVNGIIKALKYYNSIDVPDSEILRALDWAVEEYVHCVDDDLDYRERFDKTFMFVCFPKHEDKEEQEDKDE